MTTLTIVPYQRRYRDDALSLMFYAHRTHAHLDWYQTSSWLDHDNHYVRLAYEGERLIGLLAISSPLHNASWIRLVAVRQRYDAAQILQQLWEPLREQLRVDEIQSVTVLVVSDWMEPYLDDLGFIYQHDVVTMRRNQPDTKELTTPDANGITIRSGYLEDIDAIQRIDHAAFDPPWQMSQSDIRQAQRQAATATLAEYNGEVIGYQISTRHHTSGHLARLAVLPTMQGKRVGGALLNHLINFFDRRGVRSITVNTQETNERSQRLYRRFGFMHNGFDLPIWHQDL